MWKMSRGLITFPKHCMSLGELWHLCLCALVVVCLLQCIAFPSVMDDEWADICEVVLLQMASDHVFHCLAGCSYLSGLNKKRMSHYVWERKYLLSSLDYNVVMWLGVCVDANGYDLFFFPFCRWPFKDVQSINVMNKTLSSGNASIYLLSEWKQT